MSDLTDERWMAREIERLTAEHKAAELMWWDEKIAELEAVVEDFKQFAAYIASKSQYDLFRKTEEYAKFFDGLAALQKEKPDE